MTIRPALPGEYDEIGELLVRVYGGLAGARLGDYADELRAVAERARQAEVLVAVDGAGRLLGSVTNVPDGGPYAEISRPDEAEFRMLVVDPAARRQGVGQALVERCVEAARARGKARLVLSSAAWMTAAHRLYERLGFRRTPTRDWAPRPDVCLVTYELDL